jgi:uncharacterized peroxidase-related enzyme
MESHENDLRSAVGSEQQARAIQDDFHSAGLPPRELALLDFAVKLTCTPREMQQADIAFLRAHGFSDQQLVDAVQCIGYFNFINRVLDGLGVDPEASMRYGKEKAEKAKAST